MRMIIFFSIMMTAIFSTSGCHQLQPDSKQSASEFVKSFYKTLKLDSQGLLLDEVKSHKKWFIKELNQLFENALENEKEFLEKNPTDKPRFGDGIPIKPLEVGCFQVRENGNEIMSNGKTLVKVDFFYKDDCSGDLIDTYEIELIENENSWLINDCIYPEGHKLTDLLKMEN